MDPDAALTEIRTAIEKYSSGALDDETYADYLTERCEALDEWLTKGGFLPDVWKH